MLGIAKDRNMPISTRVHAAVKAVGDKIEKQGHDVGIPFRFIFLGCFLWSGGWGELVELGEIRVRVRAREKERLSFEIGGDGRRDQRDEESKVLKYIN